MLTIRDIVCRIGGRNLIDGASARVAQGHHVALVGRNGTGKTTLFRLILGELQPDGGAIELRRGMRIATVAQEAPGGATTPLEAVLAADTERTRLIEAAETEGDPHAQAEAHERLVDLGAHAAPARAAAILAGLGFDHAAQNRPLQEFSGGWRMRVALAAALFVEPDLLLLDEPTNHLDLEAAMWLEAHLKRTASTLLLISHDRHFLNAIADQVLHLHGGKLTLYEGDYDTFERTRQEKLAHLSAMRARMETQRKHMQSFVDRFRYKASKARQAQSRLKMIARLAPLPEVREDPSLVFRFAEVEELPPPILATEGAAVGYEPGKPVLRNLNLRIDPDDRIALLGANGNGKSTLARLIAGRLDSAEGEVARARKMRVGYFAQHQLEELDADATPLDHMARLLPGKGLQEVRGRLGRFGFSGDKAETRVGVLSGGEKARLTIALMSVGAPHVLILDEPTNHLDIDAREALIEGLNDFPGAVVLVSHDRHLVDLVADRLWLVANGTVTSFDGDLDAYRDSVLAARAEKRAERAAGTNKQQQRRAAAVARAEMGQLRQRAREAEQAVEKAGKAKKALEAQLADPATYGDDKAKLADLMRRQAGAARTLAQAEERWLEANSALEAAEQAQQRSA